MSISVDREDKIVEKRSQSQIEVIDSRLSKINEDINILQSLTGVKKQQVSQKNLDQLMSLLNKKIQSYSFPETLIGQNHYKLVQKGMDAPSLERKLQEQRFLAEKELSSRQNLEKSLFWTDIVFSKEGIEKYLESNQNYLMFNAIDTLRSRDSKAKNFANRLLAKKQQLRGVLRETYSGTFAALAQAPGFKYDQFNQFEQKSQQNVDIIYIRAMNQLQSANYTEYCNLLANNSHDFKEVWLLLKKMVPKDRSSLLKVSKKFRNLRRAGEQNQNYIQTLQNNYNLQNAYHNSIEYLQQIYRKNSQQKKQNFEHIYQVYNVERVKGFADSSIPIWQEIYQLFRAGDYQTIFDRCMQFQDVESIQQFAQDFNLWINNKECKIQNLRQKMNPSWDAFRYQIYLIMIKDPQCVDEVFIEDLDDCLWMNLKCSEVFIPLHQQVIENPLNADEEDYQDDQYDIVNRSGNSSFLQNKSQRDDSTENFYQSVLEGQFYSHKSEDDILNDEEIYSWVDWSQLQDLRKMLYESFEESPEVFNPSRVLMIQLLTLDFIGFTQTLRQLEKRGISQHEFIHFLVIMIKTGLIRASIECAAQNSQANADAKEKEILIQQCREFEEFAEKQIILYAQDIFNSHPDTSLTYIESLPIQIENQLQKYANIIVNFNQNLSSLFKPNLQSNQLLETLSYSRGSQTQHSNQSFGQQLYKVNNRLKNTTYAIKNQIHGGNNSKQNETLLTLLARIVSTTYIQKKNNIQIALEILDNIGANEQIGQILKEQYRIITSVFQNSSQKSQFKNHTDQFKLIETLEIYSQKYFGKKSKLTYCEEQKQIIDGRIIHFYQLINKMNPLSQNKELNITPVLQEMQELQYISSAQKENSASEFYEILAKEEKISYFYFLYLIYISCKKFFDSIKNPSLQSYKLQKPEDIEKAKKIYKSIIKYSNEFSQKYQKGIERDFENILNQAKQQAQLCLN